MAKNSKSDVAKKAAIIGGAAVLGGGGAAYAANAFINHNGEDDQHEVEPTEEVLDPEMEVEEDVEVEYDEEPVAATPTYHVHPVHEVEVVDPLVEDVNDVALVVEPEDAFIDGIEPATDEAIEIAEVVEEDYNTDEIVDDILSDDTSELSYNETVEDPGFAADFDYASGDLG